MRSILFLEEWRLTLEYAAKQKQERQFNETNSKHMAYPESVFELEGLALVFLSKTRIARGDRKRTFPSSCCSVGVIPGIECPPMMFICAPINDIQDIASGVYRHSLLPITIATPAAMVRNYNEVLAVEHPSSTVGGCSKTYGSGNDEKVIDFDISGISPPSVCSDSKRYDDKDWKYDANGSHTAFINVCHGYGGLEG